MLLVVEGLFMLAATAVAIYFHFTHGDQDWQALAISSGLTMLVGALMWRKYRVNTLRRRMLTRGDSFVIVALTWVVFSLFGMIPYILYEGLALNPLNAYFETMSGFSTFGATLIPNLDDMPHGLLLWRSLTQWMGGLGIVVFSIALLPTGEMRNSNMFMAEASAISMDRLRPKIGATARRLLMVYLLFTVLCAGLYWLGPMTPFDALNHGLTTVSTGGFSTHNAGLGFFRSAYVEYVAVVFMLLSAINFTTYYYLSVRQYRILKKNEELHWFLLLFLGFVILFILLLLFGKFPSSGVPGELSEKIRAAVFHVASTISTCSNVGEYSNYVAWGAPFVAATILIKLIGGCTYSTAGGVKVGRLLMYVRVVINEFRLHLHPHAIVGVRMGGHVVPDSLVRRAISLLMIYLTMTFAGILLFAIMGYTLPESADLVVSSLSNVGPDMDYMNMNWLAKSVLCFYMVAGRLEIFTLLFLFMPKAWKR